MKNINYKISSSKIVTLLLFLAIACSKDEVGQLSLSRQFSPTKFTITNGETQSTVTWSASLFTTSGNVSYAVEVDSTTAFSNPAYTTTTSDVSVVLTDNILVIKKNYYTRVKAIGQDKTGDSYWAVSSSFKILGEQFLNPVPSTNVIDTAVLLTWRPSTELTKIVVTPTAGGTPISVNLSVADLTATLKQVGKLTQKTAYTAEIFAGAKTKGTTQFTTVPSITGSNIIDLTGTTGNPGILVTTLTSAPSGSVIVLRRGEPYDIATAYSLSKSVTIISALGFGTNYARLRMGSNFNIAAGTIDSLVFKDLVIKGTPAALAANAGYVINANVVGATVGKVRLDNCSIKILRGVVRGQAGGAGVKYNNYIVNNCMIDSIRDFAVAAASGASAFVNIKITNTTVYRARKVIIHAVTGNATISIENCTFNELPSGTAAAPPSNFFIDLSTFTTTTSLSIKNSIFGAAWIETSSGGTFIGGIRAPTQAINVVNSYTTSDFFANPGSTNPISGVTGYSGSSTALFKNTDPALGSVNFGFKDTNFIGKGSAGDPRWR